MIGQVWENDYSGYLKLSNEEDFVSSMFECAAGDFEEDISDKVCHVINNIELREEKEYYEEAYPEYIKK